MKYFLSLILIGLCSTTFSVAQAGTTVILPAHMTQSGCNVGGDDCGIIIDIPDPDPGPFPGGCPACGLALIHQATEQQIDNDLYQADAEAGPSFPTAFSSVKSVVYSKTGRDITSDIYSHLGLTWYPVDTGAN